MKDETNKKGPVAAKRTGRFQVSIWKRRKVIPARNDFEAERERDEVRACIQHSRYKRSVGSMRTSGSGATRTNSGALRRPWTSSGTMTEAIEVNRFKVHYTIERIKQASEFPFAVEDVEEDISQILAFFQVDGEFESDELAVLREELGELALAEEFAEAARAASVSPLDRLLTGRAPVRPTRCAKRRTTALSLFVDPGENKLRT